MPFGRRRRHRRRRVKSISSTPPPPPPPPPTSVRRLMSGPLVSIKWRRKRPTPASTASVYQPPPLNRLGGGSLCVSEESNSLRSTWGRPVFRKSCRIHPAHPPALAAFAFFFQIKNPSIRPPPFIQNSQGAVKNDGAPSSPRNGT